MLGSVVTGLASLNQLAASLKELLPAAMARQSLHERFDIHSTTFLIAVLCDLMDQLFRPATAALFYVDPADPEAGGTGHTIRVCGRQAVPVAFQEKWAPWTAGRSDTESLA